MSVQRLSSRLTPSSTRADTHAMRERGYTLVEVLVAMVVLVVGMLGTVKLVDSANATTAATKAREGATNLAREVVENARVVDYGKLTAAGVTAALQARDGLQDAAPGTPGWTVVRRGRVYTLSVTACTYDDAKDSVATTHDASFCASTPTTPTTPAEINPDDFRRVDVTVTWDARPGTAQLRQTALIINPSGGLGPRISSFLPAGSATPAITVSNAAATSVPFDVTSTFAATVHWSADDAVSGGEASGSGGSGTAWTFDWPLGQAADPANRVIDGTYQVGAQAFDSVGNPGDLRTVTVSVNRSLPFAVTGLQGGRDDRIAGQGPIVDLQWQPNEERDILGYRVYRVGPDATAGTTDDVRVCPAAADAEVTTTSCYDATPPASATAYYVRAVDVDAAQAKREGAMPAAPLLPVPATASVAPTFAPADQGSLTVSIVAGLPTLVWAPASDDGSIRFYRVYRDGGTTYADRHDRTESAATRYVDPSPGASTVHTYWVTAVDDQFNESQPIGPVTSP